MKLGINLPWGAYGWDFGRAPVSVDGNTSKPSTLLAPAPQAQNGELNIDLLFAAFKKIGIECVRIFILTCGANMNPPTLDKKGKWQVTNSDVKATGQNDDFIKLLDASVRQNIQIMPVFVDFLLFSPPSILISQFDPNALTISGMTSDVTVPAGTKSVDDFVKAFYAKPLQAPFKNDSNSVDWHKFIKGGRAPILRSAGDITNFLTSAFVPLLDISSSPKYKDRIFAWDIINEPEVAISKALSSTKYGGWLETLSDPVTGLAVSSFIEQSAKLIIDHGMNATVGFQTAMPLGQDDGFQSKHATDGIGSEISKVAKTVKTLIANPAFFPHCHYYPTDSGGGSDQTRFISKKDFGFKNGAPLILGEFATRIDSSAKSSWGIDIPGYDNLTARLNVVENKGYDWAFPWSATNDITRSRFNPVDYQLYQTDTTLMSPSS